MGLKHSIPSRCHSYAQRHASKHTIHPPIIPFPDKHHAKLNRSLLSEYLDPISHAQFGSRKRPYRLDLEISLPHLLPAARGQVGIHHQSVIVAGAGAGAQMVVILVVGGGVGRWCRHSSVYCSDMHVERRMRNAGRYDDMRVGRGGAEAGLSRARSYEYHWRWM